MKIKHMMVGALLLVVVLALAACTPTPGPEPTLPETLEQACPTAAACPAPPAPPAAPACPECPAAVVEDVPFQDQWVNSAHAASDTEPFRHWDGSDPAEVPTSCAKCHSSQGYMDFLGADGSEAGKVDAAVPAAENKGIECTACHNSATATLSSVTFPSGVEITGLGAEARCMVCHQGRASKVSVDSLIEKFQVSDVDAVVEPVTNADGSTSRFGFINIHYFAAAATLYAGEAQGAYQYEGQVYDFKNRHVDNYDTCIGCHSPHTLEVKVEQCSMCHEGVASVEDLKNVRMVSSAYDYDGDGNKDEGVYYEIEGLKEALYAAIQAYAKDVVGTGILYDSASYPYFFTDADNDGKADEKDGAKVSYTTFTARLMKAAYNYQVASKDPGNFAHSAKYTIQYLYDSIADLNAKLGTIDMTAMHRNDAGHFAGNTEPFRHWDAEGEVPASCARCHSDSGLPTYIKEGVNISAEISNGFMCVTCHNEEAWPERYAMTQVTFPSGKVVSLAQEDGKNVASDANLCIACHQGRESTASVDRTIGSFADAPDAVALKADGSAALSFRNIHYFAAGATLFGNDVQGAYVFKGKEYAGLNQHPINKCTDCHDVHALEPKLELCAGCHPGKTPEEIRMPSTPDYDGDGDTAEGVKGELDNLAETLYAQLQTYATANAVGIVYSPSAYPYFFADANGDGQIDVDDKGANVRFTQWTPNLLRAAFNYQYYQKDPGAFVHNPKFVAQFLIDSIEALGGDVAGYTRP